MDLLQRTHLFIIKFNKRFNFEKKTQVIQAIIDR